MSNAKREITHDRFGYAYVSGNGKMVVDDHVSDGEHLLAEQIRSSQPLYDCRLYLDDVVPAEWVGMPVHVVAARGAERPGDPESVVVTITLIATDRRVTGVSEGGR